MIIILTDDDLNGFTGEDVVWCDVKASLWSAMNSAEDVYFWRDGEVKALKRRDAPLEVPDWLQSLQTLPASDYEV